ncbi:hypothetical protein, partial [Hahella ganghwensis]|uniref:hypothetical protein n=1 Tax=Hahella ganghwensis TaxID=286420 RepID=UPI0003746C68
MPTDNPLQFAVVREDPVIDLKVIQRFSLKNALLVASGGCTALSLLAIEPSIDVTVFDPNPHQIAHVRKKLEHLSGNECRSSSIFNVENNHPTGINESGNFESLFRGFRQFVFEHILDEERMLACLLGDGVALERLLSNKYWPVAFELFFNESYLEAMFGPNAIQHAPRNSYARYFRLGIEEGLSDPARATNYFLHHIFLGKYLNREGCLPPYLTTPLSKNPLGLFNGYLSD